MAWEGCAHLCPILPNSYVITNVLNRVFVTFLGQPKRLALAQRVLRIELYVIKGAFLTWS